MPGEFGQVSALARQGASRGRCCDLAVMASLIISSAHARRQRRCPKAAVIEPSMPGCPHYSSPWLAQRIGHSPITNAMKPHRSEIDLRTAQHQVVTDAYSCRSEALLYLQLAAEGCVDWLRGNPR